MEEVFNVAAANVACLNDDKQLVAAVSRETGWDGPMAEELKQQQQQQQQGLANIGDQCELLGQHQQLTHGRQGQVVAQHSGRVARAVVKVVGAEAATI